MAPSIVDQMKGVKTYDDYASYMDANKTSRTQGALDFGRTSNPGYYQAYTANNPTFEADYGKYLTSNDGLVPPTLNAADMSTEFAASTGLNAPVNTGAADYQAHMDALDNKTQTGNETGWGMDGYGGVALGVGQLGLGIASFIDNQKTAEAQRDLLKQQISTNASELKHTQDARNALSAGLGQVNLRNR